MSIARALVFAVLAFAPYSQAAAQAQPAVDFEGILGTTFGDSNGRVVFSEFDIVFAPEGQATAEVALINAAGEVLARHKVYEDYRRREGVFGRVMVAGMAEVYLKDPGVYTIVYLNAGVPITRCAVLLVQTSAGDDPFNPVKTFRFDGPWRQNGHITYDTDYKGEAVPLFTVWLGGIDLAEGAKRDLPFAQLTLGGKVVAHSKRTRGEIKPGHFKRTKVSLFQPHTAKESPNALPLTMKDLLKDGVYDLKIARQSDDTVLRHFRFSVKDGKLQPHPRSAMDLESHTDYLVPRVIKKGATSYAFIEATWMQNAAGK